MSSLECAPYRLPSQQALRDQLEATKLTETDDPANWAWHEVSAHEPPPCCEWATIGGSDAAGIQSTRISLFSTQVLYE